MMERTDSGQKLYTRMRLWEFPDQYIVEPTDGSSGSFLAISRDDGSMKLIGLLLHLFQFDKCCCQDVLWLVIDGSFIDFVCLIICSNADVLPECSTLRVPKIRNIFGVIGMLKLLAGLTIDLFFEISFLVFFFFSLGKYYFGKWLLATIWQLLAVAFHQHCFVSFNSY